MDGIPADFVCGKGDRIGLGHQVAVTHVDDGGILADARPDDHARTRLDVTVDHRLQEIVRQFAEGQVRHRADYSNPLLRNHCPIRPAADR